MCFLALVSDKPDMLAPNSKLKATRMTMRTGTPLVVVLNVTDSVPINFIIISAEWHKCARRLNK